MSEFSNQGVDFAALERELELDRKVRIGRLMLDIDESIAALDDAHRRCQGAFDELEALLDKLDHRHKQ